MDIKQTVSKILAESSVDFIEDVAAHGIHNITNDFHGDTDAEYQAYAHEFSSQSEAILRKMTKR